MLRPHTIRALAALTATPEPVPYVGQDGQYHPEGSGGGGPGGGALLPMKRTLFVDGDSSPTSPNGAAAIGGTSGGPFLTGAAALASLGTSGSSADSQTIVAIVLSPAASGYSDTWAVQAYRTVAFTTLGGEILVSGDITVSSVAGGGAVAGPFQQVYLDNVFTTGTLTWSTDGSLTNLTLTVDGGGVEGLVSVTGGVGIGLQLLGTIFLGGFDSPGATISGLGQAFIAGALTAATIAYVGTISFGGVVTLSGPAFIGVLFQGNSNVAQDFTCSGNLNSFESALLAAMTYTNSAVDGGTTFKACQFNSTTFNDANLYFRDCIFDTGLPTFHDAAGYVLRFDGPSVNSLFENGFSLTGWPADVVVLVDGGYRAGIIERPNLLLDQAYTFALNGAGASAGFTSGCNHARVSSTSSLSANRELTLLAAGAEPGDTFALSAPIFAGNGFVYIIVDNLANQLGSFTGSVPQFCELMWDGTQWQPIEGNMTALV